MGNVIYIDVLIVLNIFINYFLLLATTFFLHQKPKRWRLVISAVVGSLFSLLIFFDNIPFLLITLIKLPLAAVLVLIAFGYHSKSLYIKSVLSFFAVNFIFGGVMMAVWMFAAPSGMYYRNGTVYFNLSALTLIAGTLIAYFLIQVVSYLLDHRVKKTEMMTAVVEADGKQAVLSGFWDTGNKLSDRISGMPVVICEFDSIKELIPVEIQNIFLTNSIDGLARLEQHTWMQRIRMVPFQVVDHSGMLTAFRPDHFYFIDPNGKKGRDQKVLIGVTDSRLSQGEYNAILSTALKT